MEVWSLALRGSATSTLSMPFATGMGSRSRRVESLTRRECLRSQRLEDFLVTKRALANDVALKLCGAARHGLGPSDEERNLQAITYILGEELMYEMVRFRDVTR